MNRTISNHPYTNKTLVLTSKHEKLGLIKPAFDQYSIGKLTQISLDTDQLGTFSGEIERVHPPRETAIKKARLGMSATGSKFGIASEGSVGPDPVVPLVSSNIEHLVLVDDENEIVISETFRSFDIKTATIKVRPGEDLSKFILGADFPNHRLIVRPNLGEKRNCIKGIGDSNQLVDAIEQIAKVSSDGLVIIESDLRAMNSPSRQKNISEVAKLLALKVSQLCPECNFPGWGRVEFKKGVRCSFCRGDNPEAISQEILGCVKCEYRELGKVIASELDPAKCQFCNP